jgi:hypothetical protein
MVDFWSLIWHWLIMFRSATRDTHHTVAAGIMEALGKGFLIATAGVVAGLIIGTAPLASIGMWTVGVAAASGVGCMIGSALIRNAGFDRCEIDSGGSPQAAISRDGMAAMQGLESGGAAPEERWARRVAMSSQQHEHGTGRSV